MLLSLCGKSGSGKSTLAKQIKEVYENSIIVDIDKIGHEVLLFDEVKQRLVLCFGKEILIEGQVDRKKLGPIVFSSSQAMEQLTEITWHAMEKMIDEIIKNNKDKMIILDWLLLPQTKYFEQSDLRVLIDVPFEERMKRVIIRDNISEMAFKLRDDASIDYGNYCFDIVVEDIKDIDLRKLVKV